MHGADYAPSDTRGTLLDCTMCLRWHELELPQQLLKTDSRIQMTNKTRLILTSLFFSSTLIGCTQETQNKIGRSLQNWTGANGVLEVYSGGEIVKRFIKIDKLSTATSTDSGDMARPYRFAYGVLDANMNGEQDANERKVYFEISDYSTNYVFYGDPGS